MAYQMGRLDTLNRIGEELGLGDAKELSSVLGYEDVLEFVRGVDQSYHDAHKRVQPEDRVTFDQYARECIRAALERKGYRDEVEDIDERAKARRCAQEPQHYVGD